MRDNVDIVIITALDIERNAVLKYLPQAERIVNKGRVYYRSKIYKGGDDYLDVILLSLPYMGNVNSSIATTQAIEVWNPRYIIVTGIAGGFKRDGLHLGDLIVAEQTVYYDHGKLEKDFSPRFLSQPSSMELLNYAHDYNSDNWFLDIATKPPVDISHKPKVHFGIIATGEKVISNQKFGDDLQKVWTKLLAIEMEGYGSALAAFQSTNRPGFLMVKSICDWADSSKNDNWQLFCAHAAASYTIGLLKTLIGSSFNWNKNRKQAKKSSDDNYNGRMKICICRDLLDDWHDLADYFDIPQNQRRRFLLGRECQGIWEWLEAREKLEGLVEGLRFIQREDLLRCMNEQ